MVDMVDDLEFWEGIKDYDQEIVSLFVNDENPVAKKLDSITEKSCMVLGDLGCGPGNLFPWLEGFAKVYCVDRSKALLQIAKTRVPKDNFEIVEADISNVALSQKLNIALCCMSLFPKTFEEFNQMLRNIRKNMDVEGELIMVVPSMEAKLFSFTVERSYATSKLGYSEVEAGIAAQRRSQDIFLHPFGFIRTPRGLVQKHWLADELQMQLFGAGFSLTKIGRFYLNWENQIRAPHLLGYPRLWYWYAEAKPSVGE
ncbi:MAG: class I SAM-dependent methyltransferase [Alphaproteobacteria bacterium]